MYICTAVVSIHFFFISQLALTISALVILIVTSRTHPYTQMWANMVDWLIMLDLAVLSAYFVNFNQLHNDDFAIVLLILPFIYFSLYVIVKILYKLW